MESQPLNPQAPATCAPPAPARQPEELRPHEIAMLLTVRGEIAEDDRELIDMRYQLALARLELEDLFAEGQLGCT